MSLAARLLFAAMALAMLALIRAIEWAPPEPRLLRLWRLAGQAQPLTAQRWLLRRVMGCGTARSQLRWRAWRRDRQMRRALPDVVDRLSIALGCGLDWPAALQLAAQTAIGRDICRLLERRALLTPASLAPLARALRHEVDALNCVVEWSLGQGIAAYDLRHDATAGSALVGGAESDRLWQRTGAHHPGHA